MHSLRDRFHQLMSILMLMLMLMLIYRQELFETGDVE